FDIFVCLSDALFALFQPIGKIQLRSFYQKLLLKIVGNLEKSETRQNYHQKQKRDPCPKVGGPPTRLSCTFKEVRNVVKPTGRLPLIWQPIFRKYAAGKRNGQKNHQ